MTKAEKLQGAIADAQREREAELLTDLAAEFCERAANAWGEIDRERNRDDCERARRLLPGQLP